MTLGGRIGFSTLGRAALWLLLYAFLLSYLHPELIVLDRPATGGDMASHYPSAVYLRDYLLPQGKIVGWQPGNYAGFPQFQLYFPLPFLIMAALSLVMPLAVAFKIVSVAGLLLLPPAAGRLVKHLGFKEPAPDLAAVFSLCFLFLESNSAWGGNIPSTLAGEFTYSLGLSLSLIYLGRLYRDIDTGRRVTGNALLLALVGLSHGYNLLVCVLGASFFLLTTRNWTARFIHLLKVNLLAFCLLGFWLTPLLIFLPYTTPFNFVWVINDWREVFPVILWPALILAAVGLGFSLIYRTVHDERPIFYLLYLALVSAVFYLIAFKIGVVDVRFLPYVQLLLVLMGAVSAGRVLSRPRARRLAALALALAVVLWTAQQESYISRWAAWNFSGWPDKPLWPAYEKVVGHLKGDWSSPRVACEHAALTAGTGTVRAFESLPFFARRATLEGAYIQASPSSPAVFYLQSEISAETSAPLSQYNYSRLDLDRARRHFRLFNVGHYVSASQETMRAALNTPGYVLEKRYPPYAIFRLEDGGGGYAVQPAFRPVLALTIDPRRDGFTWLRQTDAEVPLVLASQVNPEEEQLFAGIIRSGELPGQIRNLPRQPLPAQGRFEVLMREEEIIIDGARPGVPLWIKVSSHPNWKVEGAPKVWRTAPSFLLVFPTERRVRLYYERGWPDLLGLALTWGGILWAVGLLVAQVLGRGSKDLTGAWNGREPMTSGGTRRRGRGLLLLASAAAAGTVLYLILAVDFQDPTVYFNRGIKIFRAGDYARARLVFQAALDKFPLSPVVDQTFHYLALTYFKQGDLEKARGTWKRFESEYPETRLWPEAQYHIGLTFLDQERYEEAALAFTVLTARFPESSWADEAGRRLLELDELSWRREYEQAVSLLGQGRTVEARLLLTMLRDQATRISLAERAGYQAALCLVKEARWSEAETALGDLLREYPDGQVALEVRFHLSLARLKLGDHAGARTGFQALSEEFPETVWGREARRMLLTEPRPSH
ncbi:MAG: 6-pyruvoyl-tetrahydropterin synthase-related protein [Thermodesulfobacteriota bacterium]